MSCARGFDHHHLPKNSSVRTILLDDLHHLTPGPRAWWMMDDGDHHHSLRRWMMDLSPLLRCCHVTCTTWYEFARSRGSLTDHVMRDSLSERATSKGERESWSSSSVCAPLMDGGWITQVPSVYTLRTLLLMSGDDHQTCAHYGFWSSWCIRPPSWWKPSQVCASLMVSTNDSAHWPDGDHHHQCA